MGYGHRESRFMKTMRKRTMPILITLVVAVTLYGIALVVVPMISPRPDNLGVQDGQLAPCPASPNCVSSQTAPDDHEHHIDPLPMNGEIAASREQILSILEDMPHTTIITADDNYVYAEVRTAVMRYIDDVEFYFDAEADVIHVRSASRLGNSDMGANRDRIEGIWRKFNDG